MNIYIHISIFTYFDNLKNFFDNVVSHKDVVDKLKSQDDIVPGVHIPGEYYSLGHVMSSTGTTKPDEFDCHVF